ncbi:MAG: hypothetical protein HY420_00420 [Candidatus Kerfeldbacteria bacterium]|nr:hypothetical protein [Candidatus Kerfeldbacteria bacterium]
MAIIWGATMPTPTQANSIQGSAVFAANTAGNAPAFDLIWSETVPLKPYTTQEVVVPGDNMVALAWWNTEANSPTACQVQGMIAESGMGCGTDDPGWIAEIVWSKTYMGSNCSATAPLDVGSGMLSLKPTTSTGTYFAKNVAPGSPRAAPNQFAFHIKIGEMLAEYSGAVRLPGDQEGVLAETNIVRCTNAIVSGKTMLARDIFGRADSEGKTLAGTSPGADSKIAEIIFSRNVGSLYLDWASGALQRT